MTNSLDLYAPEPMNHPKRTQEIATILCELLGGDIELPRKIVSLLKEAETEWSRDWHIHRYRYIHISQSSTLRCWGTTDRCHIFPECSTHAIRWPRGFTHEDTARHHISAAMFLRDIRFRSGWGAKC